MVVAVVVMIVVVIMVAVTAAGALLAVVVVVIVAVMMLVVMILAVLVVMVMILMIVVMAALLMIMLVVVMMAVLMSVIVVVVGVGRLLRLVGRPDALQQLLLQGGLFDGGQDGFAVQLVPGGGDQGRAGVLLPQQGRRRFQLLLAQVLGAGEDDGARALDLWHKIGRASCRERV